MSKEYDIPVIDIHVEGGLVQDVIIPEGCNVKVRVKDYDKSDYLTPEEREELSEDEYGEFQESIWD